MGTRAIVFDLSQPVEKDKVMRFKIVYIDIGRWYVHLEFSKNGTLNEHYS